MERAPFLVLLPFFCMVGACLQVAIGVSWLGCEVSPAISAVSILELATNSRIIVNLEMSRWCHSLWISLHSLKARVWPLLW